MEPFRKAGDEIKCGSCDGVAYRLARDVVDGEIAHGGDVIRGDGAAVVDWDVVACYLCGSEDIPR